MRGFVGIDHRLTITILANNSWNDNSGVLARGLDGILALIN